MPHFEQKHSTIGTSKCVPRAEICCLPSLLFFPVRLNLVERGCGSRKEKNPAGKVTTVVSSAIAPPPQWAKIPLSEEMKIHLLF